jgi:choline dehydrogenase-like flavoprotein
MMNVVDGSEVTTRLERDCDVVIVGSGPAGATVARQLARQGVDVVIVEQGPWVRPEEFPDDMFSSLAMMWRDMGSSLTDSWPPMPVLQGVAVGGSSVVNGSICWRLPEYVYESWCERDPALREAVPWEELVADFESIEQELNVSPTRYEKAGRNNQLFADGATALGLEHKPTDLNAVEDCPHGMRGCPEGHRMSMDQTYLPEACKAGAEIISCTTVRQIDRERGRAVGVRGLTSTGGQVRVRADRGVVLAASAIQTPALLIQNGIRHGPVGDNLQGHPGTSIMGRFDESVAMWEGPTQGHEMIELRDEGIKMETLGYNPTLAVMRMKSIGRELAEELDRLEQWAHGGAAIRADARGSVRPKANGEAKVRFSLTEHDLHRLRRGVAVYAEILLAAGAEEVSLGPHGWHHVTSRDEIERFKQEGPVGKTDYEMILSHMFGTCQMGSDPSANVVDNGFQHHAVDRLFVADSSVFPSNTGVNPQIAIMAMARHCARSIVGE